MNTNVIRNTLVVLSAAIFISPAAISGQQPAETLVRGNTTFAIDLYKNLAGAKGNLFLSPYSISTAFGMTWAGARGGTEKQMAAAMRFSLDQESLHETFQRLSNMVDSSAKAGNVTLAVANSLWPQKGYPFLENYTTILTRFYGAATEPLDYKKSPVRARTAINRWVADRTSGKITDLVPPGVISPLTRLTLVNAIYFKGTWLRQFKPASTKSAPFYPAPKRSVRVMMMRQKQDFGYAETDSLQILELPYTGGTLSMLVLLPKKGYALKSLESALSAENLEQWKNGLSDQEVEVFLPRFRLSYGFRLDKTLKAMGMTDAFDGARADFSGMDGNSDSLYISAALHKAFVEVNEEGTEAAAATTVMMGKMAAHLPPPVFRADHPFLFLIQDKTTGSVLFIGRLVNPNNG